MKFVEYYLEIYEPDSAHDVLITFSSNSAFMAISKGDILNSRTWDKGIKGVLKVVNVEHVIWEVEDHVAHKIMVFTKEVEDTGELRKNANQNQERGR